jgi:hypothetical protein
MCLGVHWRGCRRWRAIEAPVSNGHALVGIGVREREWCGRGSEGLAGGVRVHLLGGGSMLVGGVEVAGVIGRGE